MKHFAKLFWAHFSSARQMKRLAFAIILFGGIAVLAPRHNYNAQTFLVIFGILAMLYIMSGPLLFAAYGIPTETKDMRQAMAEVSLGKHAVAVGVVNVILIIAFMSLGLPIAMYLILPAASTWIILAQYRRSKRSGTGA
ncbi:hypothetical protein [Maritalea mobilis]|uniref:hypothetical protein n=1 Tax=Maritalea mobilis TaxID=483324 RepID=UPI00105FC236|nr:hypothetical protein [Maritalea mobilis]